MESKCEKRIFTAIKSKTKSLSLDSSKLTTVPTSLGRLTFLTTLSLKNNSLKTLPTQISVLESLFYLNVGSNELEDESLEQLLACTQLTTLHLFKNNIHIVTPQLFHALTSLRVLNLNYNSVSSLPGEVALLQGLEQLSLSHNQLHSLPWEVGALQQLRELHVDNNVLCTIPSSIYTCRRLCKLLLHKNRLQRLPDTIGKCKSLVVLDVSCNDVELFPESLCDLKLREFYFDSNPLLPHIPVPAMQEVEVLQLREIAARAIVREMDNIESWLERLERWSPGLGQVLGKVGRCAMCGGPYLQSWLQCVQFKPTKKVLPLLCSVTSGAGSDGSLLPIHTPLCSYHCFNSEGHTFLGIATP